LKLEIEKYRSLAKREDTPMRDISDTKIFPSTNSFSLKRANYESKSTNSKHARPIKRIQRHNTVTPSPIMPRQPSMMASQRTDSSMPSTLPTLAIMDHKKMEKQASLVCV
jgi:hypothetical protein